MELLGEQLGCDGVGREDALLQQRGVFCPPDDLHVFFHDGASAPLDAVEQLFVVGDEQRQLRLRGEGRRVLGEVCEDVQVGCDERHPRALALLCVFVAPRVQERPVHVCGDCRDPRVHAREEWHLKALNAKRLEERLAGHAKQLVLPLMQLHKVRKPIPFVCDVLLMALQSLAVAGKQREAAVVFKDAVRKVNLQRDVAVLPRSGEHGLREHGAVVGQQRHVKRFEVLVIF